MACWQTLWSRPKQAIHEGLPAKVQAQTVIGLFAQIILAAEPSSDFREFRLALDIELRPFA